MENIPIILTAIYLVLVALAIIPIFTGNDALSGILAVALTMPWNSLLRRLISVKASMFIGLVFVAIGAVINAATIYYVSGWIVNWLAK